VTGTDAATIEPTAQITRTDRIAPTAQIARTAQIAPSAVIGSPFRPLLDSRRVQVGRDTVIAAGVWVGEFAVIGEGVAIGANSLVEDYVVIQAGSEIGERVVMATRARIGIGVTVGNDSVVKGHVGDSVRIGARCRIAGDLIHRQLDPSLPWDDEASAESAPVVEDGAFVGWGAIVIGDVNVGEGAYVCASALVTKNVPAGYIARGRNQIMRPSDWSGELGKSPFFRDTQLPVARTRPRSRHRTARKGSFLSWTGRESADRG
jgi:UDP-3-O-[3-hydroxymyristoyl] glucosamine N-acyltransferase